MSEQSTRVDDRSATGNGAATRSGPATAAALDTAMSGGKVGERYHKRVDRAGFVD